MGAWYVILMLVVAVLSGLNFHAYIVRGMWCNLFAGIVSAASVVVGIVALIQHGV
jgi:hypothetical protein